MSRTIVMLGDSLTEGNAWGRAFPEFKVLNLGIGGDTCAGLWCRLGEVVAASPDLVFLMIGTNDFLRGASAEEIVAGHLRIWEELARELPKAELHVQAIPPYMEEALPGLPPNLDIMELNRLLAEEAASRSLPFIDVFSALADEDRQLPADRTTDGLHLSSQAYRLWEDLIRTVLKGAPEAGASTRE